MADLAGLGVRESEAWEHHCMFRDPEAGCYEVETAGAAYLIEVAPAKKPTMFGGGISRFTSLITRDRTYWLTVTTGDAPWPILGEKYATEAEANYRAKELVNELMDGSLVLPRRPNFGRPLRRIDAP